MSTLTEKLAATTQVNTGMESSISQSAAETLDKLKNPYEAAEGADGTVSYAGEELPGYYTVHMAIRRRKDGTKLESLRLGGRFFFPLSVCGEEDKAEFDKLVKKGLMTHVAK